MAKTQKKPERTCADCIHEFACRLWTDGRRISDASASLCPGYETVKDSGAYYCGVLDERKRKRSNADRIRAMSDEELADFISNCGCPDHARNCRASCKDCVTEWLKQPAEE